MVQRRATNEARTAKAPVIAEDVLHSPGNPLDPATRACFEPRFGHDFSKVRIHSDAAAAQAAKAVHAHAFTSGANIVFARGQFNPATAAGKKLLAHELAHVVQQGYAAPRTAGAGGRKPTRGPSKSAVKAPGIQPKLEINEPGDRFERDADRAAEQVLRNQDTLPAVPRRFPQVAGSTIIQRDVVDDVADAVSDSADAVEEGAHAVGSAVNSAARAVGQAGSDAFDWLKDKAGSLAMREASDLARLYGGKVTLGQDGIIVEIPDIKLLQSKHRTLIPSRGSVFLPLLPAGFGSEAVQLSGALGVRLSAPTMSADLGPGGIRNIRVRIDPFSDVYSAAGEAYLGAAASEFLDAAPAANGTATVKLPTNPPKTVKGEVEGGYRLTLRGSGLGSLSNVVTLSYSGGKLNLDQNLQLKLGVYLEADTDFYVDALLQGRKVCEWAWPHKHWEKSKGEQYALPIHISLSSDGVQVKLGEVEVKPLPIEGITPLPEKPGGAANGCRPMNEVVQELCKERKLPEEVCDHAKHPVTPPPLLPPRPMPLNTPPVGPNLGPSVKPSVGPAPAAATGPCPAPPPQLAVLYLPSYKGKDYDTYNRWLREGPLQHRTDRSRNTGQLRRWRSLMPGRIPAQVKQRAQSLGLSADELIRPYWSKSLVFAEPMEVDHVVEIQVAPIGGEGRLDNMANYRLMAASQNGAVGPELSANIARMREHLAKYGGSAWETCWITFDRVEARGIKAADTWTKEELQMGVHLDAFERLGKPPRP